MDRRTLVKEAISKMKARMVDSDRNDFDRMIKGTRVDILGRGTSVKETEKGNGERKHTYSACTDHMWMYSKSVKERMEVLMRKSGTIVSFQWPKECLDFVDKIRTEVHKMGYDRKDYYTRVRPAKIDGQVLLRAETKKKEGGKFEGLAYWRAPPDDKEYWKRISKIIEPECK